MSVLKELGAAHILPCACIDFDSLPFLDEQWDLRIQLMSDMHTITS